MQSNLIKWIIYIVLILATVGLLGQLVTDPLGFIQYILMTIGFIALIGGAFYYFFIHRRRRGSSEFRQAVKQSKKKYGTVDRKMNHNSHIQKPDKLKKNRSNRNHLKVIKGNKK
ncbi:hypothetical protein CEY16_04245 [Halalkalibacillus sediminis]|uniref:Uncharacterized protein n=1 Tax=Halalkalibacillus sediminis TaxID=2018042 RepID=A0A2I0QXB1_9BACI|nr:SA1362 family protein [Halalkalibacillus sediminis]PKR78972.1 hypothetical protein CEY16_04245 [Halalkalibacillus sediminis]